MKISVLNIGNELLKGSTLNTNLAHMGQQLIKFGAPPILQLTVNDDRSDLLDAIEYLEKRSSIIIVTGGLGPTTDDITVEVFAQYFGLSLYSDKNVIDHISNMMGKDKILSSHNKKQAVVPEGSTILENRNGTAPGIYFESKGKLVFLLPGPPSELIPLFNEHVILAVRTRLGETLFFESIFTSGIAESELQRVVSENIPHNDKLYIAYRAEPGACELSFCSKDRNLVMESIAKMHSLISDSILLFGCKNIAEELIIRLTRKNLTLGFAESCTGGMLSSRITDIPGASKVFKGAVISYANEVKTKRLNVKEETLENFGAVSAQCAAEMAEGCAKALDSDIAVSITGIAGPDGGTQEKPVGTVFIGIKILDMVDVKTLSIKGDRSRIRIRSVSFALNALREALIRM